MELRTVLFLVVVVCAVGAFAAPTGGLTCASKCVTVYNPKFKYDVGKVYTYSYESSTSLIAEGAAKEEPGFKVKAIAEVHVLSACELLLKLSGVKLEGDGKIPQASSFKQNLESKPLLFAYTDGRVDHVCPDNKDPAWSVNIKRAILSSFQNSMDKNLDSHVREADVIGLCDTHYSVKTSGKSTEVVKTKDVISCTNRQGNITSIQANHYGSVSPIQSSPLLKSTYSCLHVLSDGVLKTANCEEIHKFGLHNVRDKGAATKTNTKLSFTKSSTSNFKNIPRNTHRAALFYDHAEDDDAKSDKPAAEKVLNEICSKDEGGDIPFDAAELFTRLVYLVRRLTVQDIQALLTKVGSCKSPKAKDNLISSLSAAGTESALRVLVEILKKGEISELRTKLWLSSLAFIARPTPGAIDAVTPIISSSTPSRTALLGISAMVHAYCRQNTECAKNKAVQKVLDILSRNLGNKCKPKDDPEEDRIVATLKAFGNVGRVGKYGNLLLDCVKDTTLYIPIRLAAIEAFRRTPSDEKVVSVFTQILADVSQNAEVRIASYLGLIKRATPDIVRNIKGILDTEPLNQVSAFIKSHLGHLSETQSPLKRDVKRIVQNAGFKNTLSLDPRKFSANYETSRFSERFNLGGTVDSNVIFSPDSFLPRSAMFNLSLDIFGSSVDLFEFNVRGERFDHFLESYFGPNGKISQLTLPKLRERWYNIAQGIENEASDGDHSHHKRALPYEADKLKLLQDKASHNSGKEPEGSYSIKIFGNELRWRNFHTLADIYDKNDPYNLQDIFNKLAKHKEFDIARNWLFVDSTFSVPTASGFPLKWDLNGTLSFGLKLNSHFDVRQFFLKPRKVDIKSFIQPSVNIQWGSALILDAHFAKTGLKLVSNLYSASAFDGTVQLKEGELFTAKLDIPKKEMNLLHVKSRLYIVTNNADSPATPVYPEKYNIEECSQGFLTRLGLQLCGRIQLPKPLINPNRPVLPLGGPVDYGITLKKIDEGLQGFHFTSLWKHDKDSSGDITNTEFKLSFDTPGSSVDREYTIDFRLSRAEKLLRANLKTPERKISLNGNYVDGETLKEGTLTLNVNGEREYSVKGKTGVKRQGNAVTYTPVFEITRPNTPKVVIKGTVIRTIGSKVEFDIKSDPSSDRKIAIKGVAERDGDSKFGTEFQVSLPYIELKFDGNVRNELKEDEMKQELELDVEYAVQPGGEKRTFSFSSKTEFQRDTDIFKLKRFLEWKTSRLPDYNGHINWLIERVNTEVHSFLDVKWGRNFDDPNHKLFFEHKHKVKRASKTGYDGEGSLKLIYPLRKIDWNIKTNYHYEPSKTVDYNLEWDKVGKLTLEFKNLTDRLLNLNFLLKIELPNREIVYKEQLQEKKPKQYEAVAYIQWQKGEHVTLTTSYKDLSTPSAVHHELEMIIVLYTNPKPIRKYKGVIHFEPKKFTVTGKVETPETTYLVDVSYEFPVPHTASFKLVLKLPWIEGEINSKRTVGEFDGNLDLKTEKRRVVGNVNLKGSETNKVLVLNLKWDVGKDETKKLSLKADIERPRVRAANIKATLELPNRSVKGDIRYELPFELFNGQHNAYFDIEYAPGKKLTVDSKINIDKTIVGRRLSSGEVRVNSAVIDDLKIAYNTDFHKLPDQRSFKANVNIDWSKHGNTIIAIDYLRGHRKISSSVDVTYPGGKSVGLGIGAFFDVGSGHGFDVGGTFKLKTPMQGLQDILLTIREGFQRSPEYTHIIHDNHVRWAPEKEVGAAFEWTRKFEANKGFEIGGRLQFVTPLEHLRTQKIQADLAFQKDPNGGHLSSNFDAVWGTGKKVKALVRYNRDGGKIDGHLLVDGREVKATSFVEIIYNRSPVGSDEYASQGTIKYDNRVATFVNKGLWTPTKKTTDLTLKLSPTQSPVNIKGSLTVQGEKRNADLTVVWGPENSQKVSSVGEWTHDAAGNVLGSFTVTHSSTEKIVIDIERKNGGPKRSYGAKFNFGPERQIELGLTVNDKSDKTGKAGKGIVNVNGEEFITFDFDIIDKETKKNRFGRVLSYSATVNNQILSFSSESVLLSEKGFNPSFKICTVDKAKCFSGEILVDLHQWDTKLGPIDDTIYFKVGAQRGPGDSRTVGFSWHVKKIRDTYERSAKIIVSEEEKKFIGYIYKKVVSGDASKAVKTRTYQVLLPSRIIEARSEKKSNPQGFTYNLHLLLDAIAQPKQELLVSVDVKNSTVGQGFVRKSTVLIKHPKLSKDISVTSELKVRQGSTVLSLHTELDLSTDPRQKFIADLKILEEPSKIYPKSHNHSFYLAIKQATFKNLDFRVASYYVHGEETRSVHHEFYWLSKSGEPKIYSFSNEFNKIGNTVKGLLHSPYREFTWEGVYRKFDDGGIPTINADVDLLYNGKLFRRAALAVSRISEFNFKYYVDPSDTSRLFRLHGGILDDTTYHWTATRIRSGQETEDVDIYVKLNNTNLLYNRYIWRPSLLQDIRQGIEARVDKVGDDAQEAVQNFFKNVKEESSDKIKVVREALKTNVAPLVSEVRNKLSVISSQLQNDVKVTNLDRLKDVIGTILGPFFETDALNAPLDKWRDNYNEFITRVITRISDFFERAATRLDTLDDEISAYLSILPGRVQEWRANVRAKLPEIADKIQEFVYRIRDAIDEFVDKQYITKGLQAWRDFWDSRSGTVKDFLKQLLVSVFGPLDGSKPVYEAYYERIRTILWKYAEGEGPFAKALKGILTAIKSVKERIQESLDEIRDTLKNYRETILAKIFDLYNRLLQNPEFKALMEEIRTYRQQVVEKYFKEDSSVKETLRDYVDKALAEARQRIHLLTEKFVFDLKGGRVEFYLPLLVPIESLRTLSQGFRFRELLSAEPPSIIDSYHRIRPLFTRGTKDYLPPFVTQAMLIGNQHFMTFDKQFYDFAGKCQYVLTNDFVDQNFSVIISYDADSKLPKKNSFIIVSDFHHIEVKPDYKVILDEQEIELPTQIEQTVIHRDWNTIRVDNSKGFSFAYDVPHDIAIVNISGWYFGKVAGLFGNNNNEPNDDLRNPEGEIISSVTLFANTWDVSNQCPLKDNFASHDEAAPGSEGYAACYELFVSRQSTFTPCTPFVKPDHFFKICLEEVAIYQSEEHYSRSVCRAAAAYIHACAHYNVHLTMPHKCLTCKAPDDTIFSHGDVKRFQDAEVPKSADVVFIIEQKECNRRILLESLDEVAKDLEKELKNSGFTNNRYGIVGFGGEGAQKGPHSHTAHGQLFTDASSVALALKNLAFWHVVPSDTLGAIQYATRYPFRTGVAKIGILYLCERCSEAAMTIGYSDIQRHLLRSGLSLHIVSPESIEVPLKPKAAMQLIGFDAQTTYNAKDSNQKSLIGDPDLRHQLRVVKDICFTLAQELNGSVFRSDLFGIRKNNPGGKSIRTVFVRRVVSTAQPSSCQACTCGSSPGGTGISLCHPCVTPKPRQVIKSDAEDPKLKRSIHY